MKLVLFHNTYGFDVQLQAAYLNRLNIPYWLYCYNFEKSVFQRGDTVKEPELLDDDSVLITLEDRGDFFGYRYGEMKKVPGAFFPANEELRFNPHFIQFVEEFADELEDTLEVIDIPKGDKYRITSQFGGETLEFERDILWSIAE